MVITLVEGGYDMENNKMAREKILNFLQWNDRHGCYNDENCDIEGISPLSYNDALKLFFGVVNEDFYYSKVDNIFELSYEQTIEYAKQNGFYDSTIEKLELLIQESLPSESFYRSLI